MTLVSSIIADAYRESNMLPLGKEPSVDQGTEALRLYNALIKAIYGNDAGEPLGDWPLGAFDRQASYGAVPPLDCLQHPDSNSRLIVANAQAITVYLTAYPQDGARMGIVDPYSRLAAVPVTLDANGRTIEGAPTLLLNVNGTFQEWFYRADLAGWVKISDLEQTDENPFPEVFDMMFIIMLAMRLNPRYGRALDEQSVAVLKQNKRDFVTRYLQSSPLETDDSISWPFMSRQGYVSGGGFSSTRNFARGRSYGE